MNDEQRLALLAGALVGDALGAPFNSVKSGHILQLAGAPVEDYLTQPVLFPDKPLKNHLPGAHTSLGQTLLALLASQDSESTGQAPVARAASHLRDLGTEPVQPPKFPTNARGSLRCIGKPMRHALETWDTEYPWEPEDHFARSQPAEGASTAFAALASVLFPEQLQAIPIARLTHLKESSLIGSAVIARAAELLAEAENPKKLNTREICTQLLDYARTEENKLREGAVVELWNELDWGQPASRFSECLAPLESLLEMDQDPLAEKTLLQQANEFKPDRGVTHVQHGFAPILIPWVLYRALGPMSHSGAVEDALNRGGETSLTAGLISALMAVRYGFGTIREEWIEGLLIWPQAKALLLSPAEKSEEEWLEAERAITQKEEKMRLPLHIKREKNQEDAPKPKKKKPAHDPAGELPQPDSKKVPFAAKPQAWLEEKGDEISPWEKKRLKAERGKKRIEWKDDRRKSKRDGGGDGGEDES